MKTLCTVCLVALLSATPAAQPATGGVRGRVVDTVLGTGVPGVSIVVDGSASTTSNGDGTFRLRGLAPGTHTVAASSSGYEAQSVNVIVTHGREIRQDISLFPDLVRLSAVLVRPMQESRMRALSYQRFATPVGAAISADQVGRLPDTIVADALQRVPGATLQRDHGQGRYVGLRGLSASDTSVRVNGHVLMSPEGDSRPVALDTIPANLIHAIEIALTPLPSADADGIGGTVNLVTINVPQTFRALTSFAGGYNSSRSDFGQGDVHATVGGRIAAGRIGLLLSASASTEPRGTESMEATYEDAAADEVQFRHYTIARRRIGGSGTIDYNSAAGQSLSLTGLLTHYVDDERRQRLTYDLGSTRLERELKDRLQQQSVAAATATVNHMLGGRLPLDMHASFTYADEREPDRKNTAFRQKGVQFGEAAVEPRAIRIEALNEDYSRYTLSSVSYADVFTRGRELAAAANVVVSQLGDGGTVRVGAKARIQRKERQSSQTDYSRSGVSFLDYMRHPVAGASYLSGLLDFGPGVALDAADRIAAGGGLTAETDHEESADDYRGREVITAAYGMADWPIAGKWTLTPGLRVEHYAREYDGHEVWLADGASAARSAASGQFTALPSVHLRMQPDTYTVARAAFTRSLSRPDYQQLVPMRTIDLSDQEMRLGNTELRVPTSWNIDAAVERYLQPLGVLSVSVFQKWLRDRVWYTARNETIGGEAFTIFQPVNGPAARLRGVELAFENQLSFLPVPLDGVGVYASYRLADSSVAPDRTAGIGPVPGQPRHAGNFEVSYEKRRFSGRMGLNVHGSFLDNVDAEDGANRVYGSRRQLDASATVAIARRWRAFAEGINLTNAPIYYYETDTRRPVQVEYYKPVFRFGVRANF
jgi:TonB-dependent receptor